MPFIQDGYQTLISFGADPLIVVVINEKEVQPPDLDGGGEIDTTTMRNLKFRTKNPKSLVTLGDMTVQINYDPVVYTSLLNILNVNNLIRVIFPDGSTLDFWGWIDKFTPASLKEGEFPLAELKIHSSNHDQSLNETEPIFTPV